MKKLYKNEEWLHEKYIEQKLSTIAMGKICGVAEETIRVWLNKFNIKIRTLSEAKKEWHKKNPDAMKGEKNSRWGKHISQEHSSAIRGFMATFRHTEETKRKMSENSFWRGRKHTEEVRKKISIANKGKKLSAIHKRILRESHEIRPTKPEKEFANLINIQNVRYVGDGKWWIKLPNGKYKNPDFKITGMNKVIEIYGNWFHRNDNPQDIISLYKEVNLNCLVIWEKEIYKNPNQVIKKVKEFLFGGITNERTSYG